MATTQFNETSEAIHQIRERFIGALRQQNEHIKKLDEDLKLLQNEQRQLEEIAAHLTQPLQRGLVNAGKAKASSSSGILLSIRKLAAATYAEQVFAVLAEEAGQMNIRAAVFDVRGRAVWGSSACGFDPKLSNESLRTLVVPLNHEGPFQRACETGEAVEANAKSLAKNRNVLARLNPAVDSDVLLIPVRSAGSVVAVFYAETRAETHTPIVIDSLKVLVEFAGAQIDRLMAIDGSLAEAGAANGHARPKMASESETAVPESESEAGELEVVSSPGNSEVATPATGPVQFTTLPPEEGTDLPASQETAEAKLIGEHQSDVPVLDIMQLSQAEQKIHRDAQRFSKLLVSEIELYNMSGVQEGRKNRDLYLRLKKDIDRSRETYEKRFSNTVAKQVDYFHEELVKRLAENDPSLLGSDYPGPSV